MSHLRILIDDRRWKKMRFSSRGTVPEVLWVAARLITDQGVLLDHVMHTTTGGRGSSLWWATRKVLVYDERLLNGYGAWDSENARLAPHERLMNRNALASQLRRVALERAS